MASLYESKEKQIEKKHEANKKYQTNEYNLDAFIKEKKIPELNPSPGEGFAEESQSGRSRSLLRGRATSREPQLGVGKRRKPTSEKRKKERGKRRRVPRGAARAAGAGAGESERPSNPAARSPGAALAAAAARLSVPSRRPAPSAGLNLPFAHFARSAGEQLVPGNMQRAWILLTLGLVAFVSAESRAELTSDKDMYLDNSSIEEASGVYPIDDDDYASASGSGADEDIESPELTTSRPIPRISFTSAVPKVETTTLKTQSKMPAQTKSPEEIDKEEVHMPDSERKMDPADKDTNVYTEKHSDNLFKRTEVLAAVIAGGVIGFLFAIFLILLLVYRMRKKDEGSYDLGERKPSSAAYQKAPTKEFYA
ncbi:syndecan-2 [Dipodomys merriami]|uniref:syndecan-2 n=1 Tax=Dipodomys merriami TaxID=94247 RepID=UPI003855D684